VHRFHPDEFDHRMPPEIAAFMKDWLRKYGALIVAPDPVRMPNNFMPGTFTSRPGVFGQDEPMPPYEPHRQMIEDAKTGNLEA